MTRQVILYTDEEGNWIAEVPSLPGCGSEGKTRAEALTNVRDAIEGFIEALESDGLSVPPEIENRDTCIDQQGTKGMEYRQLGRTGVQVSPLCLGGMLLGGKTPEPEANTIIDHALDAGLTLSTQPMSMNGVAVKK